MIIHDSTYPWFMDTSIVDTFIHVYIHHKRGGGKGGYVFLGLVSTKDHVKQARRAASLKTSSVYIFRNPTCHHLGFPVELLNFEFE